MRVKSVLFEADEPVEEARARSLAINEVLREPLSNHLDAQRTRLRNAAGIGVASVVLGVLGLFASINGFIVALFVLGGLGIVGYTYVTSSSPDITVTGIEKGYWKGQSIPAGDGAIVYDNTGSVGSTAFELERLSDETLVADAKQQFTELEDFPTIMPREEDIEARVTETLEDVRATLDAADQHTVEAPVVSSDGPEADAIKEFVALADTDDHVSVDVSISPEQARADIETLTELEQMAAAEGAEAELDELSNAARTLANDLSDMHEEAIELLNDHVGTAADAFGLVSYNFYCPDCQTDDIDSIVELTAPAEGHWHCSTCRTRHDTEAVIPRHRLKDEIVNPTWDQLWIEKDDQRREVYENIEDQKAELQEREFEQRREEIRSSTDRIQDLRSRIRDLQTQAKAAEGTVTEIGELMVKYERLNEERKRAFEQDVEASFAEIDAETDRILAETRTEEHERIEAAQEAARQKAMLLREDEHRRDIEKFVARQQHENTRVTAAMQHQHHLHDEELELEKRHHREDWMLKTRGRTSFSARIDKAKLRKDRFTGKTAAGVSK